MTSVSVSATSMPSAAEAAIQHIMALQGLPPLPGPGEPGHDPRQYYDYFGKPRGYWDDPKNVDELLARFWIAQGRHVLALAAEPTKEPEPLPLAA